MHALLAALHFPMEITSSGYILDGMLKPQI